MIIRPMPVIPVVRICRVRTFNDRYEVLDWLQLFARGDVHIGVAW